MGTDSEVINVVRLETDATRWRSVTARLPLVVIGISLVVLGACSSSSGVTTLDGSGAGTTPTPEASADPEDAIFAFTECMREHGIDMPDPEIVQNEDGAGGGGMTFRRGIDEAGPGEAPNFDPNSQEFQEAQEACQEHLDGFAAGPGGDAPELSEEEQQAMLDFAQCMRDHGIDMPDPQLNGPGFHIAGPGDEDEGPAFDPMSEEFQAAEEACREHLDGVRGPSVEEDVQ
jgi:hypothetical protein